MHACEKSLSNTWPVDTIALDTRRSGVFLIAPKTFEQFLCKLLHLRLVRHGRVICLRFPAFRSSPLQDLITSARNGHKHQNGKNQLALVL